jgi:hypothetical protein
MQINLPDSGTIFFISDHCHVIENVSYRRKKRLCCFERKKKVREMRKYTYVADITLNTVARRNPSRLACERPSSMVSPEHFFLLLPQSISDTQTPPHPRYLAERGKGGIPESTKGGKEGGEITPLASILEHCKPFLPTRESLVDFRNWTITHILYAGSEVPNA